MSAPGPKGTKNSLSIRLTESAVFLRTNSSAGRSRVDDSRPSMLRGLLTLELVKPTKISTIEIELQAKTATAWPEGIGARRIEVTEEHRVFQASTVYFHAGKVQSRRTASIGPGVAYTPDFIEDYDWDDPYLTSHAHRNHDDTDVESRGTEQYFPQRPLHSTRRVSVDSPYFPQPTHATYHEEMDMAPIPPYSPFAPEFSDHSPASSATSPGQISTVDGNPAHSLEEFRNSLQSSLRHVARSQPTLSVHGSIPSLRPHERSLSRRPSMEDVPEYEPGPSTPRQQPPSPQEVSPALEPQSRGRKGSRFSFSSVSNVLIDAVRSGSPRTGKGKSRERSLDAQSISGRGRTMGERNGLASSSPSAVRVQHSKERTSKLTRVTEILKPDPEKERDKDKGDGWKEFKKGIYTYPISFAIPGNSPPTMECDYGSVTWKLKATVHRPGAFKAKLTASREVMMIACPTEDDTEDTENIIVERHWDSQLQYLISISGRSFYIGGTVPVTFTMMPLTKIKIHRISVLIEERVDYYTQMRRIARTDPIMRIELLSIKGEGKGNDPILPLNSDDANAFHNSPLYALVTPEDDVSELASSLMGPGPWTFHQDLKLPSACSRLKFTNRNRRCNIVVTHMLKCVMRVERGDDLHIDPKTGKRKMFDIVVQAPIQVLSCRCNPEWMSLPKYSESLSGPTSIVPSCPCQVKCMAAGTSEHGLRAHVASPLERKASRQSSDSSASTAETHPVNPVLMRSLTQSAVMLGSSSQFERLISGQESEIGEAPPAYATIVVR